MCSAFSRIFAGPPLDQRLRVKAVALTIAVIILGLYVFGMVAAYRAAGGGWSQMDRDVKLVYLLAVPLFQAGVRLLLWVDRLFFARSGAPNNNRQLVGEPSPRPGRGRLTASST